MWDQRYDCDEFVDGREPNDFLTQVAESIGTNQRILCLGEGEGRNSVYLASLGHRVSAVDASAVGLEKARTLATQRGVNIETIQADLNDYDPGASRWDCIVSIFCHLPPALRKKVHRSVVKALKPGGVLILEGYSPDQLSHGAGGPPQREMLMTLAELKEDFQGLDFKHAQEIERELCEGRLHNGPSAVVQLLARKPS